MYILTAEPDMEKEEALLRKRIEELARVCYQRDIPTHTDFLNLNEQTIFHSMIRSIPEVRHFLTGGYAMAERKVVCFLPSYALDEEAPISCMEVEPLNARFAEELSHRDYLGALMNLGIDRSKIGDILVQDKKAYVFVMDDMSAYLAENLISVRKTTVKTKISPAMEMSIEPRFEQMEGSIASERLDNILAFVYRCSRGKIVPYVEGEKVFVNGRLTVKSSAVLKPGDIVSVRGLGKFRYLGIQNETKKGRLFVAAERFI